MIDITGSTNLAYSSGRPRIVRTPEAIGKIKTWANASGRDSVRKMRLFRPSIHRDLKADPKYRSYRKRVQLFLKDAHKAERKALANWIHTNFRNGEFFSLTKRILDVDGPYNLRNDGVWAPSRSEVNERGGIDEKRKFPQKIMVWLGACSRGISP